VKVNESQYIVIVYIENKIANSIFLYKHIMLLAKLGMELKKITLKNRSLQSLIEQIMMMIIVIISNQSLFTTHNLNPLKKTQ